MKKSELQQIIKEEYAKLISEGLITEKFQSPALAALSKMLGNGRWNTGKKLFTTLAKNKGFDWANTPNDAVSQGNTGSTNKDVLNVYIVTTEKRNTTSKGEGWRLDKGLLGMTMGNKIVGFNANLVSNKGDRAGATYSNKGISNFKQMNAHADKVVMIDTSKVPSSNEIKRSREEAKKGATALMKAKEVLDANKRRYQNALTMKAGAEGWKGARKYVTDATAILTKAIASHTKMLSSGMIMTGWDTEYGLAARMYENIMKEFQNFQEQNKAYLDNLKAEKDRKDNYSSKYSKDRMDQTLRNMKEYSQDFTKRMVKLSKMKPVKITKGW